ncbi:hypothetical protein F4781DRAFT_410042 [Annulohypoxylon bovei var. microspora]|nr:hypothetical protein F4781DRAFT_410042 [Annulohypoxylon bovei var. microspora]
MAMSNISMPSFDFTKDEKSENENHINYLLYRSMELLDSYRKKHSAFDLHDASVAIQDALAMANDPGACESPPLAKCYLSQGHILGAMEQYPEARNAYRKAAKAPPYNSLDRAASEQAADWAAKMDQRVRDGKRKGGIWPDIYQAGSSTANPVQPPGDILAETFKKVGLYHAQPPVKDVGARKTPQFERPQLRNSPRPQRLVPCKEGWTAEGVHTPVLDHRGMLLPSSPVRSFKEHLAIRTAMKRT